MENKYCPRCGNKTLRFIEKCDLDSDTIKTSWACNNIECQDDIIYIYHFIDSVCDYISICSSPTNESCAQVGSDNYFTQSQKELKAFINQLRRKFGKEPGTAYLKIKSFPHDFGTYHEVVCYYNDEDEEAINYAFKLESETPEYWDEEAKKELEEK